MNKQLLDVIHHYKYNHALWFEPFLAGFLIQRAQPELAKDDRDFIVPVPLYSAKLREREFNQAERLGRCLRRATGIPCKTTFCAACSRFTGRTEETTI